MREEEPLLVEPIEFKSGPSIPWPAPMSAAVRIGVLGELLDLVEEQTEADPAAIALDFLTRVGNAVGRGPHFEVSGDRHGTNLFACIVGTTGQGRKGSSAAFPSRVLDMACPEWSGSCVKSGLSSGEGIIHAIRDAGPSGRLDKDGNPIIEPGVEDKRLLAVEPELARTLRAAGRRDSILASVLRQAWDGVRLASLTKVPYCATGSHCSLLSHVTPEELRSLLRDDDVNGGTVNRFLFIASRRQRSLPYGGSVDEFSLANLAVRVREIVERGASRGTMSFTAKARELWPDFYARLQADEQAPGIAGKLLGRATAQTRRLAMEFAIVDGKGDVDVQHLLAAREVWRFHRDTVRMTFGSSTGNKIADRILGELRGTPDGLDRTDMHKLFDRHVVAADIDAALKLLNELKLAHGVRVATAGRPREIWHATTEVSQ